MTNEMPAIELIHLIDSLDATDEEKQALRACIARLTQEKWEIARAIKDLGDGPVEQ